ncbi:uncharacterized protein METZ01_LOCUS272826, partial [marine metagenome]
MLQLPKRTRAKSGLPDVKGWGKVGSSLLKDLKIYST